MTARQFLIAMGLVCGTIAIASAGQHGCVAFCTYGDKP